MDDVILEVYNESQDKTHYLTLSHFWPVRRPRPVIEKVSFIIFIIYIYSGWQSEDSMILIFMENECSFARLFPSRPPALPPPPMQPTLTTTRLLYTQLFMTTTATSSSSDGYRVIPHDQRSTMILIVMDSLLLSLSLHSLACCCNIYYVTNNNNNNSFLEMYPSSPDFVSLMVSSQVSSVERVPSLVRSDAARRSFRRVCRSLVIGEVQW